MGCGASVANSNLEDKDKIEIKEGLKAKYNFICKGNKLLCLDEFVSKYNGKTMRKWREAEIVDKVNANVKIHFNGWTEANDVLINLDKDWHRLAPHGLLPSAQINSGTVLSKHQESIVQKFLTREDELFEVPLTHIDSSIAPHKEALSVQNSVTVVYKVGEVVDVKDYYKSKQTHSMTTKWRKAIVREVSDHGIRVHYVGWDDKWDDFIDLTTENDRISKENTMTALQVGGGDAMNYSPGPLKRGQTERLTLSNRSAAVVPNNMGSKNVSFHKNMDSEALAPVKMKSVANLNRGMSSNRIADGYFSDSPDKATHISGVAVETNTVSVKAKNIGSKQTSNASIQDSDTLGPMNPQAATQMLVKSGRHSFSGNGNARIASVEKSFEERMEAHGLHIVEMIGDGNCLFRSVAHQMYLDPEKHLQVRQACCEHMLAYRNRFESFCATNFDEYIKHLSHDGTWGDHLEIKALEEIYDRLIIIYHSESRDIVPMNLINAKEKEALTDKVHPILLSYHGKVHYNSVFDGKCALPMKVRNSRVLLELRLNAA